MAARITITRDGNPCTAVALWDEYRQTKSGGATNSMWSQRPAGQLAKCAEALAWRMACPYDLAGVYTDEEMGQADNPPRVTASVVAQSVKATPHGDVVGEIVEASEPTTAPGMLDPRSSKGRHMFAALGSIGVKDKDDRLAYVAGVIGRTIATSAEMTEAEADDVIEAANAGLAMVAADSPDPEMLLPDPSDGTNPWVTA